jgi:hypothetical protein
LKDAWLGLPKGVEKQLRIQKHYPIFLVTGLLLLAALACGTFGAAEPTQPPPTVEVAASPTLAPTATSEPVDTAATIAAGAPTLAPTASGSQQNQSTGDGGSGNGGAGDSGSGSGGDSGDDGTGSGSTGPAACPAGGQNLLANPSFEGEYSPYGAFRELNHAPSWTPWWRDGENNQRPEFKPAEAALAGNRVHSGNRAQQYFKSFGMFKAGVAQTVQNVPVGSRLQLSAHGQAWSCEEFSMCADGSSVNPSNMLMRVGIDPKGGIDPFSGEIIWSPYFNPLDQYQVACVEAVAQSDLVTVYLWASPDGPRQNQDVYWDDASLVILP